MKYKQKIVNPKVIKIGNPVVQFIDTTRQVYCKNCRWFEPYNWWGHKECWRFSICYQKKGKIYQEFMGKLELDIEQNEENNCSHYKRKWWKFWLN